MKRSAFYFLIIVVGCCSLFADTQNKISVITINDTIINPVAAEYIDESIERAEKEGHHALVIELDTPGGLLSSTRRIVKKILNAEVPVIVYVAPAGSRAGSAGVFITLASHVAAMAPSTNIGAAHPVEFGESPANRKDSFKEIVESLKKGKGEEKKEAEKKEALPPSRNPMGDKILNDTIAWVSTIAKQRGRNIEWAIRSVKESLSNGETEALKLGVVDYVAEDLDDLLKQVEGKEVVLASGVKKNLETSGVNIVKVEMTARQQFLDVLINPNIAYILMMIGFYGLLFEITHPGVWFPGVAGLICIILAFYAFQTLPTNYAGVALIVLSMALFVAEVFVTSYGLLAIVGTICLLLGSIFLIDSTAEFMQISLSVILPVVLATGLIFVLLISLAVRVNRTPSVAGVEGLVGQLAEVQGEGKVLVAGEIWEAHMEGSFQKGERVKIKKVVGMKVTVVKQ